MKITRRWLRRIILNEFKIADTGIGDNFLGGQPPTFEPPKERGGGDSWPSRIIESIINTGKYVQWPQNSRVAYHDNGEARLYARADDIRGAIICTLVLNNGTVLDKTTFDGGPAGVYIRLLNIRNTMCDKSGRELERSTEKYKQYNKNIIDFMSRSSGPIEKGPDCSAKDARSWFPDW